MWTKNFWRILFCFLLALSCLAVNIKGEEEDDEPVEKKCRPYVEKALKELETHEIHSDENASLEVAGESIETADDSREVEDISVEVTDAAYGAGPDDDDSGENVTQEDGNDTDGDDDDDATKEDDNDGTASDNDGNDTQEDGNDTQEDGDDSQENVNDSQEDKNESKEEVDDDSQEEQGDANDADDSTEDEKGNETAEDGNDTNEDDGDDSNDSKEVDGDSSEGDNGDDTNDDTAEQGDDDNASVESEKDDGDDKADDDIDDDDNKGTHDDDDDQDSVEVRIVKRSVDKDDQEAQGDSKEDEGDDEKADDDDESDGDDTDGDDDDDDGEEAIEEELMMVGPIPKNLRPREHIIEALRLDDDASENDKVMERAAEIVLRDIKKIYETSIKPLETIYKYRDLSNRHFGDPEIFSKPLVLFMGPWSGGKSTILNYLTGLEYTKWSLRSGAEPSPAYFNILMHGEEPEVLDGTQLAADWTFSGLQKFGQGLEERLRGLKHPSKILEKVNIVEIPGILEVRKQVSHIFPFNDACQWFIDRADIIFLVYDPSKLDVGPETEAILDQLKGRESQTRIILNKADTVKPEELMRVQSALIWNISPLMSSAQPPTMYTVSLWSIPFEKHAPARLLHAQEKEMLRDLRRAIDTRIENKIASARRFAVRVRNHAKMVDCYLTTYYNHKTIFGNKKLIAEAIIENPQNYHIYEGLSTLTNISRYDLPDPETYRDFFRLNNLYDFQQLSATCTYFRGCPINKLDVAIAYDLPELVGKYKKMVENHTPQQGMPKT